MGQSYEEWKAAKPQAKKEPEESQKRAVSGQNPVDTSVKSGIIDNEKTGIDYLMQFVNEPSLLREITPELLKKAFEVHGLVVSPLGDGALKDIPFEKGGGFRVNFEDGGLFQYHPDRRSHHGGEYYKISTGKGGRHWYDRDGEEKTV